MGYHRPMILWNVCLLLVILTVKYISAGDDDNDDCWSDPCRNGGTCIDGHFNFTCLCPHLFNGTSCENNLSVYGCVIEPCLNGGTCENVTDGNRNYRCQCKPGFTGINCDNNINECLSDVEVCKNGGECVDRVNAFFCNCNETGYNGDRCESDIDECDFVSCGSGTCYNNPGSYRCQCPEGFGGPDCSQDINECLSNPCQHAGVCRDGPNSFTCDCAHGYTGVQCETDINNCVNVVCPENASCSDLVDSYVCLCNPGFTGDPPFCLDIDECANKPCLNNGTCQNLENHYKCDCVAGYDGQDCSNNIDDCLPNPCQFGGICTDGVNEYNCDCALGYNGDNCSVDIDECNLNSQPCQNGGMCVDEVNGYMCNCSHGWMGDNCTVDIDECEFNPCKNGATCYNFDGFYTCTCAAGYTDLTCDEDINECDPDPCSNDATCLDLVNAFKCICTSAWMGPICDQSYNACSFDPCENGGNCTTVVPLHSFNCNCPIGFDGDTCDINIDDCAMNPCEAPLKCYDGINNYTCACQLGYEGEDCTEEIDECALEPCKNGGTCTHGIGYYNCTCSENIVDLSKFGGEVYISGYTGINCNTDIDECDYSPPICLNNADCTNNDGSFYCGCRENDNWQWFAGANCELATSHCVSQTGEQPKCFNGAECVPMKSYYECICLPGYTGERCGVDIDECEDSPCQHNGTCENLVNAYNCTCIPGITGVDCEIDIDDCSPNPCNNSGQCIDHINSYSCNCSDTGFNGTHCQNNIDDCLPYSCLHGGQCVDQIKSYRCECLDGYNGTKCEQDIDECALSPCVNGTCLQRSNRTLYDISHPGFKNFSYQTAAGYLCECIEGFTGINCETDIDDCEVHDCANGAACIDGWITYTCSCAAGYDGDLCEDEINECDLYRQPCMNGGSCHDEVADYKCHCKKFYNSVQYGGRNCTVELTACEHHQCLHSIECKPFLVDEKRDIQNYSCICEHGYTGRFCTKVTTATFFSGSNIEKLLPVTIKDISFRFRTTLSEGVLFFWPAANNIILTIEIHNKYLFIGYVDNDLVFEHFPIIVNDGNWHQVDLVINESLYFTLKNSMCNVCSKNLTMTVRPSVNLIYFGNAVYYQQSTVSRTPYIGCMQDITINGDVIEQEDFSEATNINSGCPRQEQCNTDSCNSHGACEDLWHTYTCNCKRPYLGTDCEEEYTAVTFAYEDLKSWASFSIPDLEKQKLQRFISISMFIRTRESNGLIVFLGEINNAFLTLEMVHGYIGSRLNICNQEKNAFSVYGGYDDGKQHFVQIIANLTSSMLELSVNGQNEKSVELNFNSACTFAADYLIFGGKVPQITKRRRREVIEDNTRYFKGTVQDVELNSFKLQFFPLNENYTKDVQTYLPPDMSNVTRNEVSDNVCAGMSLCENNASCENVFFNDFSCICTFGYRGKNCSDLDFCAYVTCPAPSTCQSLNDGYECISSVTFNGPTSLVSWEANLLPTTQINSLFFKIRTLVQNGVLMLMAADDEYFKLDVVGGNLQVAYKTKGTLDQVDIPFFISDGLWHNVLLLRTDNNASLKISEENGKEEILIFLNNMVNFSMVHSLSSEISMGYMNTNSPLYYKGCIREFRLGDILLPFFSDEQFNNNTSAQKFLMRQRQNLDDGCVGGRGCHAEQCTNEAVCYPDYYTYMCECAPGYAGRWCEQNIDDCASDKCGKHGVCVDGIGDYVCACFAGYTGDRCQDEIDTCSSVICAHNESCVNSSRDSYCNCTVDYVGRLCDTPRTATCTNKTCKNDGTCYQFTDSDENITEVSSGFNCTCQASYHGDLCEFQEDYCSSMPCQNNGTCFSNATILNYTCSCPTGFTGDRCERNINDCRDDSCNNGGECHDLINDFRCTCPSNLTGPNCSDDVNECLDYQPCQNNATCQNTNGSYSCDCTSTGYEGENCSEDVNECMPDRNPCRHNANCTNTNGSYLCDCSLGYEGNNCQTPNCSQVTCQNGGTCTDNTTNWKCDCVQFYEGEACEIEGPCVKGPCNDSNTVTCKQNLTSTPYTYNCDCKPGWEGQNCSQDKDECDQDPCVNGTCKNLQGNYTCNCIAGFEGRNCTIDTDDCSPNPCHHSGICTDKVNGFNCNCSYTGFTNETCMVDIDECDGNNPCLNQGICSNFDGGYNCTCTDKYKGTHCQEIVDPFYKTLTTDELWIIIGPTVAGVLVIIIIVLLIFLKIARKKRATRGAYSPSRQEMSGSRVELGNVMKQPPEERLI